MRRLVTIGALVFAAPSLAFAHVGVRPQESKLGAEEKYTVRVPREGTVATTRVQLEIPAGVTVLEVVPHNGATFETSKQGDRITAITWKKEIPPKAAAEFVFSARNPASGDLVWKAHQHFADGTAADWVGAAGERRPASVTKLVAGGAAGGQHASNDDAAAIETWLRGFDAAFNAKDLDKLATFKAKMGERQIDSIGLETLVLVKGTDKNCQIRHSHTSSRPARRPAGQQN